MAVGGFDQLTDALKRRYPKKRIEPMVNVATPFRRQAKKDLPKGYVHRGGGLLYFGANLAPPQNVGMIADGDNLPTPVDRSNDQFNMTAKLFPGTFQIGWLTEAAGNSGENAFNGGEVARRTEETVEDVAKHIERIYCGTHGTGRLATVESDGSNTLVLKQPLGVTLIRRNMRISVRTTDGGDTIRDSLDNRKITKVVESTRTITYDGADQTASANDHVHLVTKASQTDLDTISAQGLEGIIDDSTFVTTFQGIDRSTVEEVKALVNSNSGVNRDLSEQILAKGVLDVRVKTGKNISDIWWNPGQSLKYLEFVSPDRRYQQTGGGITGMDTGYTEESMVHYFPGGKVRIHEAFDISPRVAYGINWSTIFNYVASGLDWWDKGGGQRLLPVPVSGGFKAAWFAALCAKEDLGSDYPRANIVFKDLKDGLID